MTEHRIIIERADGGYSVEVAPARHGESLDRIRDTYKAARGWAVGLRLTHGWPIDDRVTEAEARA